MARITEEKVFKAKIKKIKGVTETLAQDIHEAGVFALMQVNKHGNLNFITQLIEAMGRKHRAEAVKTWLMHFGKVTFTQKDGAKIRNRKDITDDNVDKWIADADALPFWELTPEPKAKYHVDYLTMLHAIVNKHEVYMPGKLAEGKEVVEENVTIVAEVKKLLEKLTSKKDSNSKLETIPAHSKVTHPEIITA